jgi:hypothetical protein
VVDEPELDPLDFGDGMASAYSLGHDVLARWTVDKGGNRIGVHYSHPMPNPPVPGRRCVGSIIFDTDQARAAVPEHFGNGRAVWQLHSLEPLDVSPSLLCRTCGHHGFIRQGAWVPA